MHQLLHRNENNGVFSADTASMKSSTVIPSFKYHVYSKDGIQLVVDLNLKRSDWLRSMEKAVCVCQNHQKPEFGSFRKEVKCLENRNNAKTSSPGKTTASDASTNSYVQNNFSLKLMSREVETTLPSGVKKEVTHWSKNEHSSELVRENCENTTGQQNVIFSSEEIQFSDLSSHQKGSSCSRTGKICSENLLNSTIEVNQEAGGNHRGSIIENAERISSARGMGVSGEENAFVISTSDDGPKRKKRCKNDHIHGQSHERILRSTKLLGGQILESGGLVIRRSSRLLSKAPLYK